MTARLRFRELADSSPDMVFRFLLDPVPHFDYLSPSVEALTGYPVRALMDDFGAFVEIMDEESRALMLRRRAAS